MNTFKENMCKVADSLAHEAGRFEEEQKESQGSTSITGSLTPKANRSDPTLDSLATKAG
jgi:hypothetical protein